MILRTMYCSATDREVQVGTLPLTLREVLRHGASPADASVCLDWGRSCTGAMCPLFDIPSAEMRARLEAHGIRVHHPEGPRKETP